MNLRKIFTNNKLLVRLVILYLITSILLTSILMGLVSYFVSSRTKERITESEQDIMKQSYNTVYYALTNIYGDFYALWSRNKDIEKVLGEGKITSEDIKTASDIIDSAAFRDDLVDSVYIINEKTDLVLSNIYPPETIENFYDRSAIKLFKDFEKNYDSYKNEVFFPRKVHYNTNGTDYKKDYISIVYASNDKFGNIESGIIVNIDQNKLSKLVNIENKEGTMIIVNSGGEIISDSKGGSFGKGLPRGELYNGIANNPKEEDSFIGDYLGEKSFITFKKAGNIGFAFISIIPYWVIGEETAGINRVIALLFIIAMFISLIVSIISIKRIYGPLNDLIKDIKEEPSLGNSMEVDEYTFLGDVYKSLIIKNRRSYTARIFNGNYNDLSREALGFSKEKFLTLGIMNDENSSSNLLEELINIFEDNTEWVWAITSSNSMGGIINEDNFQDNMMEKIMEDLINIQDIIADKLDVTVSIGIGTVVNTMESIRLSHRYSLLAAQYALSIGENQIILYNEIEDTKAAASANKDSIADKVEEYINNNFTRQGFAADEISKDIGLSLGYIRQIFREEKGITLNDYIINCRIQRAKELLINTEDTAKDISEAVGYYDNRYFYTIFKKKVGMTTEEFRKQGREEYYEKQ
ncbi:AraC family transcriptional regulator [Tissierella sp. MB52-C2]|uniref:AraC family transcriptional regulator n=1 Tax=Tissierella sp. MB52-C2 TaxID=3070999 RepID=UPI00280A75EF|nr:AraC family transcriptional regulator [Tissierella sp. MB52-C2]WMM24309.1 AraC family transcriptional regulator [Tissierella sp. MB52-C2]